jgi:hypothetical protein
MLEKSSRSVEPACGHCGVSCLAPPVTTIPEATFYSSALGPAQAHTVTIVLLFSRWLAAGRPLVGFPAG